jgi:hypothetical protein
MPDPIRVGHCPRANQRHQTLHGSLPGTTGLDLLFLECGLPYLPLILVLSFVVD